MKRALVCGAALLVLAGCGSAQNSDTGGPAETSGPSASPTTSASATPGGGSGSNGGSAHDNAKGASSDQADGAATQPAARTDDGAGEQTRQLTGCGLTERDVAFMERDWERVVGSVGREDHHKYTAAFVVRLESLQDKSDGCPADKQLGRFVAAAEQVNKAAKKPVTSYGAYQRAANSGNKWLDQVGIQPNELAAG